MNSHQKRKAFRKWLERLLAGRQDTRPSPYFYDRIEAFYRPKKFEVVEGLLDIARARGAGTIYDCICRLNLYENMALSRLVGTNALFVAGFNGYSIHASSIGPLAEAVTLFLLSPSG